MDNEDFSKIDFDEAGEWSVGAPKRAPVTKRSSGRRPDLLLYVRQGASYVKVGAACSYPRWVRIAPREDRR